jgi:hypothetical protein
MASDEEVDRTARAADVARLFAQLAQERPAVLDALHALLSALCGPVNRCDAAGTTSSRPTARSVEARADFRCCMRCGVRSHGHLHACARADGRARDHGERHDRARTDRSTPAEANAPASRGVEAIARTARRNQG